MATDGQLQAELLSVYRELSRLYQNRDDLLHHGMETETERDKARAECLTLEVKLSGAQRGSDHWRSECHRLDRVVEDLQEALFAAIDDALDLEHFSQFVSVPMTTAAKQFVAEGKLVTVEPGVMPEAYDESSPRGAVMPLLCLSCNAQKSGFYLCEDCFEIDLDHGCDVFEELQLAWDKGERDFPRPNKNIKELYK